MALQFSAKVVQTPNQTESDTFSVFGPKVFHFPTFLPAPGLRGGPEGAPRGRVERSAAGAVAVRRPQPGQREAGQGSVRLRQGLRAVARRMEGRVLRLLTDRLYLSQCCFVSEEVNTCFIAARYNLTFAGFQSKVMLSKMQLGHKEYLAIISVILDIHLYSTTC